MYSHSRTFLKKYFLTLPLVLLLLLSIQAAYSTLTCYQPGYEPTLLESIEKVNEIFDGLRGNDRQSTQCYHRAHAWVSDMKSQCGVKSLKIFIFYSKKFQQTVDKKWWYHVAPMVLAKSDSGDVQEFVYDKTFIDHPVTSSEWVNHFSKGYPCEEVSSYQEYQQKFNDPKYSCFVRKVSMYNFCPDDIESMDSGNPPRCSFDADEVEKGQLAFGKWNGLQYKFKKTR